MIDDWLVTWLGLALGLAAALGALGAWGVGRWVRRRRLRRRFERGRQAEGEAVRLLQGSGYRVLGEQVEGGYELRVAGEPQTVRLRVDLLVERRGRCYLVEVKTGAAASPRAAATRRQMLEYRHAFPEVDGILLADMEQRQILAVDFGGETAVARWRARLASVGVGALLGAAASLLAGRC